MDTISVLSFSGIYEAENFYRDYPGTVFMDLTGISGSNCMCDDEAKKRIMEEIEDKLPGTYRGVHFIDSGNYHYVSALFLDLVKEPFSLVVLDHHPDMQRPMFDILSCGGWITRVLEENEFVRDVHIIGADEKLIQELEKKDAEKVRFYRLEEVFTPEGILLPETHFPVYLSIDKDVISRVQLITNWDQGEATAEQVKGFVEALLARENDGADQGGALLGIDICGECAQDQRDVDLDEAVSVNDEFNREIIDMCKCYRNSV